MKIIPLNLGLTNLDKLLDKYELRKNLNEYPESDLRELFKPVNLSFLCEGINRAQSTLICELCDSYCQQSQRYVKLTGDSESLLCLPMFMNPTLKETIISTTNKAIDLYNRMTELKEGESSKKRKTIDSFKYGIPYEDGRYVLPLAVKTNLVVTMSADKLIDLFKMMCHPDYDILFYEFIEHLKSLLPDDIYDTLNKIGKTSLDTDTCEMISIFENYNNLFSTLNKDNNVLKLDIDPMTNVIYAALASQNERSPVEIFDEWDQVTDYQRGIDMVNRVVSYGHTSILEHHRSTFAMTCSLSAYHQVIRHRIQKIYRQPFIFMMNPDTFDYYVPQSIAASEFYTEYKELMEEYRNILKYVNDDTEDDYLPLFHGLVALPNATMIKFVVSSNARNDNTIFRDRLCLTAQTEIREMYKKKFDILYNLCQHFYKYGVPPCVSTGKCKEGKLSCGKASEMKEMYNNVVI